MPNPIKLGRKERMTFSKINEVVAPPNLIEVQKKSYDWFTSEGIEEVIEEIPHITKEEITECARKVNLDTVYFLKGTLTDGGDEN